MRKKAQSYMQTTSDNYEDDKVCVELINPPETAPKIVKR